MPEPHKHTVAGLGGVSVLRSGVDAGAGRQVPTVVRTVVDAAEFRRSRHFTEFLWPYDTVDGLDLHVTDRGSEIVDLRICRSSRAPLSEERDVGLLRLIEPVLAGAVRRRRLPTGQHSPGRRSVGAGR